MSNMKSAHRRLARLIRWRSIRFAEEKRKLELLVNEVRLLNERLHGLEESRDSAEAEISCGSSPSGEQLQALAGYCQGLQSVRRRTLLQLQRSDLALDRQRQNFRAARSDLQLLERLAEKRMAEWRLDVERQDEKFVDELSVSRWRRPG